MREPRVRTDMHRNTQLECPATPPGFAIHEKLLVLISANHNQEYLIRRGQQIANQREIPWLVVWVDTGRSAGQQKTQRVESAFSLALQLGARTEILRGSSTCQAVVPFLIQHHVQTLLIGAGLGRRFNPWRKRLYRQLIESGLAVEVVVLPSPEAPAAPRLPGDSTTPILGNRRGYGYALMAVLLASALAVILETWFHNANLALVYVLAVIITGLRYGSRPAIASSVLSFLGFNFFLTEPRHTLLVASEEDVSTLIFLFLIAIVSGPAASRVRRQFTLLTEANRYSDAMRTLGQALSIAESAEAVWLATAQKLESTLQVRSCIVLPGKEGSYSSLPQNNFVFGPEEEAAIEWMFRHAASSGGLTHTPSASTWRIFPVIKAEQCIACALIQFNQTEQAIQPYDKGLIYDMLQQAANTWSRIQLVSDLERARVKTEVEQLRSALLSSVSHDLKSPLAAMMGAAESLRLLDKQLDDQDRQDLLDTILQESRRLDSYIQNLLDMTRLGYGKLKIERDWVSVTDITTSALARLKRYHTSIKTESRCHITAIPVLYVHAALIEQALFNILENAAKFTPVDEAIILSISRDNNKCLITIEDKGPGIPEALREKIFDMFYVVADGDKRPQGTGMGLAICRGMIAAHGGAVYVREGAACRGTCIVVELPIEHADNSATIVEEE